MQDDDLEALMAEQRMIEAQQEYLAVRSEKITQRIYRIVAEQLTAEKRREMMRKGLYGIKLVIVGTCAWVLDQVKEHSIRTAAMGAVGLVGLGGTQVIYEPSEPDVVTMQLPPVDRPMPGPTITITPTPTATPTPTPSVVTVTPTPRADLPEPASRGEPAATPAQETATLEPTMTPTVSTESPAAEPTTPEPTESPAPPATFHNPQPTADTTQQPSPSPTPSSTPQGAECVTLPEDSDVGKVCEPRAEVDQQDRWRQCLDLPIHKLVICMLNPDEWFDD